MINMKTRSILSEKEEQVARLYVLGYIGKEIAEKLNIAYRTVVVHTQNIYEKTGISRSTNALVSWWYQENFEIDIKKIIAIVFLCLSIPTELKVSLQRRSQTMNTNIVCSNRLTRKRIEKYPLLAV